MIEILPGVFFDPSKEWYEQDPALIALAEAVMQEPPISSEIEEGGGNERLLWGVWETTTSEGAFEMRVDMTYVYGVESGAFKSKSEQDKVTVNKIN